jgi:capsid protein
MAVQLNRLERAIAAVRPAWGAQRLADRMAFAGVEELARGYDMARQGRRTDGWRTTGGSPNAEAFPALGLSIRRSRDLCRNNEWARNADANG